MDKRGRGYSSYKGYEINIGSDIGDYTLVLPLKGINNAVSSLRFDVSGGDVPLDGDTISVIKFGTVMTKKVLVDDVSIIGGSRTFDLNSLECVVSGEELWVVYSRKYDSPCDIYITVENVR